MNTLGAILGSFLTGFIFIPSLGLRNTFFFSLAVYILAGEFVLIVTSRKIKSPPILIFSIALITIFLLHQFIPVGLFKDIFVKSIRNKGKLVFYKEGIVSSVGVFEVRDFFNLRYSDGTGIGAEVSQTGSWRNNHRLKAHIPMILHRDPRTVINIGFGTGISAYSLSLHNIDRVDNVEICAETFEATKFFINNLDKIFNNPKANLIVDDGRNFLFVTKRKYDVILVYPFFPFEGENIFLYTKDFFELCKARLNPGGLISVWFPFNLESRNDSLILLRTFLKVFPDAALFSTLPKSSYRVGPWGFLIGSCDKGGLHLLPGYLEERFQTLSPEVRTELMQAGINNPKDLLEYFVSDYKNLIKLCGSQGQIITDNRTFLDYRIARKKWIRAVGFWRFPKEFK